MPIYQNTGTTAKILYGHGSVEPGESVGVKKYVWPLDAAFVLIDHGDGSLRAFYPIKLYEDSLPSDTLLDLAQYSSLIISNQTDEPISLTFNDDGDNAMTLPAGVIVEIDCEGNYDNLIATGDGTGNVGIWAIRKG